MKTLILAALCLLLPAQIWAAERVVGVNTYVRKLESWPLDQQGTLGVYWRQNNYGSYKMTLGDIGPGIVECIGAGFGTAAGVRGEGICLFEADGATFTMTWQTNPGDLNTWQIVSGTGRFEGIRGEGTAKSRILSEFTALQHLESTWEGEITRRE
ncbi:MAG: hypothetical protein LJE68_08685 [Rhodobacter sp.]|nr:hypothetical protein [Rhodobacter sp.]